MLKRDWIPHVQVRENALILFDRPEPPFTHKRNTEGFKKAYSGEVRNGTEHNIRKAIDIFLQLTPTRRIFNPVISMYHDFRLGFITLTISEADRMINAKEAHAKLLRPFLDWATGKKVGVKNYIWKAELQERGQLHYHLTVDTFIHLVNIRNKWNYLQRSAGFLNGYAKKHGHFNPNSTDVHSVRNVENFEAYLAKYIAKTTQNQKALNGKVWDCSKELKRTRYVDELDTKTQDNIIKEVQQGNAVKKGLSHCTIVQVPHPSKLLSATIKKGYDNWK